MSNSPSTQDQPIMSLEKAIESINQRELVNPILALGLAALHAERGKNDEAIQIIEQLVACGLQTPEVLFALGEVYEAANLNQQAKENYNKAIAISSQIVVAAKAGLARVEEELSDAFTVDSLRQEAMDKFAALSHTERVSELGKKVDDLVQGKNKFMFLSATQGCGSCPGPGYKFFGSCLPCGG